MQYALVINDAIEAVGRLPKGADADGQWIEPLTVDNAHQAGWFPVVEVARPVSTDTDWTRTVELVNGTPTVVWTARAWTQAELDAQAAEAERQAKAANLSPAAVQWLRDQAATAAATTATSGNAVGVLNGILAAQATFLARFADLLEAQGFVRQ
jgi:hypothetical protein